MHQALEISQYWRHEGGFQAENKISLFIATGFLWNQKEGGGGRQGEKDGGDKDQEKGKREDLPHVLWLQEGHSHCGMKLVNKSTLILLWTGGFQRLKHELNLNYSFNLTLTGHSSPRVWVAQDHIERLFFPQLYRRLESSLHTNDCISSIFAEKSEKKNVLCVKIQNLQRRQILWEGFPERRVSPDSVTPACGDETGNFLQSCITLNVGEPRSGFHGKASIGARIS